MSGERQDHRSKPTGAADRDDDPVLPSVTRDEQDVGWGDDPTERGADWYERERPPHHE